MPATDAGPPPVRRSRASRTRASRVRARAALLACFLVLSVVAVACGRASEDDINSALGITPSATANAEQLAAAQSTQAALATQQAAVAAGTPASADAQAASVLANGNVALGQTQFILNCQACHGTNAPAGALNGPNNADLSPANFIAVVRDGTGHPQPPGPFTAQRLTNSSLANLYAWLISVSGQQP